MITVNFIDSLSLLISVFYLGGIIGFIIGERQGFKKKDRDNVRD